MVLRPHSEAQRLRQLRWLLRHTCWGSRRRLFEIAARRPRPSCVLVGASALAGPRRVLETVTSAVGERPEPRARVLLPAVSDRHNRAIRPILLVRPIAAAASHLWTARASQEPASMGQVPCASASGRSICLSRTTPPVKKLLLLPTCASSYFQWKCNFLKTAMPLLTDVHHHCSN